MCACAVVVTRRWTHGTFGMCEKVVVFVPVYVGDIFTYTNRILIDLFGFLDDPLLPSAPILGGYIASNGLDLGSCGSVKNIWSCACRYAMVLLENVDCAIDHALELVLYHCIMGAIFSVVDVVPPVTIGPVNQRNVVNFRFWFHGNECGNFFSRCIDGAGAMIT